MDDLAGKLNEILQNPAIANLIGQLGTTGMPAAGEDGTPQEPNAPKQEGSAESGPQAPTANPFPDFGMDPEILQTIFKIAPLLSSLRQEDENTQLLHALRPMLKEPRQKKLDDSLKLMQLMRMLPLLKDKGIF